MDRWARGTGAFRVRRPWWIAAVLALTACGAVPPVGPIPTAIDVASDRSLVFTAPGQDARIVATVLDADGAAIPNAFPSFESSDPDVASVDAEGLVVVHTGFGSAVVTIRYHDVPPQAVTVVAAELAPTTRLVASADVRSASADRTTAVLERTPVTVALQPGDVVMSGQRGGVLLRVTDVAFGPDAVTLTGTPASLGDAFARLSVGLTGPETRTVASFVAEPEAAAADLAASATRPAVTCTSSASALSLSLNGGLDVELDWSIVPRVEIELGDATSPARFLATTEVAATVVVAPVGFTARGGIAGTVVCEATLREASPLGPALFVGPIGYGPSVGITNGIELEASWTFGELTFATPEYAKTFGGTFGLELVEGQDVRFIESYLPTIETATRPIRPLDFVSEFEVAAKPFLALEFGVAAFAVLPTFPIAQLGVLELKLEGGLVAELKGQVQSNRRGYTGPTWKLVAGANLNLGPLVDTLDRFRDVVEGSLEDVMGGSLDGVLTLDLDLFQFEAVLLDAPVPVLSASRNSVDPEHRTVTFAVSTPEAGDLDESGSIQLVAVAEGSNVGSVVATGTLLGGQGSLTWTPDDDQIERYTVFALLDLGYLSSVLPYASNALAIDVDTCPTEAGPSGIAPAQATCEEEEEPDPDVEPAIFFRSRGIFMNEELFASASGSYDAIQRYSDLDLGDVEFDDLGPFVDSVAAGGGSTVSGTGLTSGATGEVDERLRFAGADFQGFDLGFTFSVEAAMTNPPTGDTAAFAGAATGVQGCVGFEVVGQPASFSMSANLTTDAFTYVRLYLSADSDDDFEVVFEGADTAVRSGTIPANGSGALCYEIEAIAERRAPTRPDGYPASVEGTLTIAFDVSQ